MELELELELEWGWEWRGRSGEGGRGRERENVCFCLWAVRWVVGDGECVVGVCRDWDGKGVVSGSELRWRVWVFIELLLSKLPHALHNFSSKIPGLSRHLAIQLAHIWNVVSFRSLAPTAQIQKMFRYLRLSLIGSA